jgi:hypothetical protein
VATIKGKGIQGYIEAIEFLAARAGSEMPGNASGMDPG